MAVLAGLPCVRGYHERGAGRLNTKVAREQTNVVQFPVELRVAPSMALIREMEPDLRDVAFAGESLGLGVPAPDLQERVAAETAQQIVGQVLPLAPAARRRALDDLLRPVVARAVEACREAERATTMSAKAARDVLIALAEGGHWMEPLEKRADALLHEAAALLIVAHGRCQEAHGVSHAVDLARWGQAWTPSRSAELAEWLSETRRVLGGT